MRTAKMVKGRKRVKRLLTLRKLLGGRVASRICAAGILPSITYGAAVNGVLDVELAKLRRIAGAGYTPAAQGR